MTKKIYKIDKKLAITRSNSSPIAIGGVGGSGTRIVAELVKEMGIFIGNSINRSNDNLSFVRSRELLEIQNTRERQDRINEELRQFEYNMCCEFESAEDSYTNWGWKVPGQFHMLPFTSHFFPQLKYIHVIRHGLDMAFSKNKNQMRNWGPKLDIVAESRDDPSAALAYWIKANQLALQYGNKYLGNRFFLINFDQLCDSPKETIADLQGFLSLDSTDEMDLIRLAKLVKKPASCGRYKLHDTTFLLTPEVRQSLFEFGFSVNDSNNPLASCRQ